MTNLRKWLSLKGGKDYRRYTRTILDIGERDGWVCYLCGKSVSLMFASHNSNRATLDHVIPRVLGGRTTPDNLRIACPKCNSIKGEMVL